jgi:hypothetical protein
MAGGYGIHEDILEFHPESLIDAQEREKWTTQKKGAADPCGSGPVSRAEFARAMAEAGLT